MSNVFTLESLKQETKKKLAPFVLGLADGSEVELAAALRLSSTDRKIVQKAFEEARALEHKDDDSPEALDGIIETLSKIFGAICDKPQKLLADLYDVDKLVHVALMTRVLSAWGEETQLGEA